MFNVVRQGDGSKNDLKQLQMISGPWENCYLRFPLISGNVNSKITCVVKKKLSFFLFEIPKKSEGCRAKAVNR